MIDAVHVIFKTHLDVGFTDLARNVVARYFDEYIPRACETARLLRRAGGPERFVWTTGSWLIYQYLEKAPPRAKKVLEKAIEAGDIKWHGLAFTTHSELMDASLFRFGLGLSQALDTRFGRKTIAAKMTDVPGHTRAIVPLLAEAGIRFLHIGVNAASTAPAVPPVFVWQDDSEADVIVMVQQSYGELMTVQGMSHAIAFAHTLDNLGPQSVEEVVAVFEKLRSQFPQASIIASDLNTYGQELIKIKSQLPIVTQEIGDTWIHGAGSDPRKISQFRELCRLRSQWLAEKQVKPDDKAFHDFSQCLLMVAEHTWGLDEKTHLGDYVHYRPDQLQAVRGRPHFERFESSWVEQRDYLRQAVDALDGTPLSADIPRCLDQISPLAPNRLKFESIDDLSTTFVTSYFALRFDAQCGAISYLKDRRTGREWASNDYLLGFFRYQTFSQADYDRFLRQYLVHRPEWARLDFSKPGIQETGAESRWWIPRIVQLLVREDEAGYHFIADMALPDQCVARYGGSQLISLELDLPPLEAALYFNLQWFGKPAARLPEAFWFSFRPRTTNSTGWMMEKMGKMISPLEVVRNGNRKLHAIERRMVYRDQKDVLTLESLDAPLVSPGEPSLLDFNDKQPLLTNGIHFNLYNNVWGTNFPMWYDEDARFRFVLRITA